MPVLRLVERAELAEVDGGQRLVLAVVGGDGELDALFGTVEGVELLAFAAVDGLVEVGLAPEAGLHVFELVQAREEGHVKLGSVSGFLK